MNVQELNKIITQHEKDTPVIFRRIFPDGDYADYSILVHRLDNLVCITCDLPIKEFVEAGK